MSILPVQYNGDPQGLYFQVGTALADSPAIGTFITQAHLGGTGVGVGSGSYLSVSVAGMAIA
jgi:hypothetical protein